MGEAMGAKNKLFIVAIILLSTASVTGLKINYNTTHPLQFMGLDSFENLGEVRVIYRAEPIDILPGQSANLNFHVENPTVDVHRVTVTLIDVPPGFSVAGSGLSIQKELSANSSEQIVFTLKTSDNIAPRSYFYGFDVIDETLASDGKGVVNTSKRLGIYNGLNVIDSEEQGLDVEKTEPGVSEPSYLPVTALLIIAVLLVLALRMKAKK